ncbi:MAG: hypothetical protein ACR2QW_02435 [bacterium]
MLVSPTAFITGIRLGRMDAAVVAEPAKAFEWATLRLFHFADPLLVDSEVIGQHRLWNKEQDQSE